MGKTVFHDKVLFNDPPTPYAYIYIYCTRMGGERIFATTRVPVKNVNEFIYRSDQTTDATLRVLQVRYN